MTSEKQMLANRANALSSTGPRTSSGRARSRRNAFKHGLTARTVLDVLESDQEFRSFANKLLDQYAPQTPLQQELVERLVAVLWRLRRAHAVETGLLSIQGKWRRDVHLAEPQADLLAMFGLKTSGHDAGSETQKQRDCVEAKANAFLRMINFNAGALDQLSRYEVALWRQAVQLMVLLGRHENGTNYETKPIERLV